MRRRASAQSTREPLDLLRVAGVGDAPDEQVTGAQRASFGHPDPGVVVGFAAGVVQLDGDVAQVRGEIVDVGVVGLAVVGRPAQAGSRELPPVDGRVVAGGEAVALEAGGDGRMGEHPRAGVAVCLGLGVEHAGPQHMVDVAMGVHRRGDRVGAPRADQVADGGACQWATGVDEHQALAGVDDGDVGESGDLGDSRRDLLDLAEGGEGMFVVEVEWPALGEESPAAGCEGFGHRGPFVRAMI